MCVVVGLNSAHDEGTWRTFSLIPNSARPRRIACKPDVGLDINVWMPESRNNSSVTSIGIILDPKIPRQTEEEASNAISPSVRHDNLQQRNLISGYGVNVAQYST